MQEQLTEKELKWAYWFATHKLLLKKFLIIFLAGVNVLLFGYSIYRAVDYFFISGPAERENLRRMAKNLVNHEALLKISALNLEIGEVEVLSSGREKYDLAARLTNPNPKWWAEFDYRFAGIEPADETRRGFILPSEDKTIAVLGFKSKSRPRNVWLEIANISMHRVNPHQIPDYESWSRERLAIEILDEKFIPRVFPDEKVIGKTTFTAQNRSAYGYWEVGFYVILYRGPALIGVNYTAALQFRAGESRLVEVTWYEAFPSPNKIEIRPEVNILDPNVFMPP